MLLTPTSASSSRSPPTTFSSGSTLEPTETNTRGMVSPPAPFDLHGHAVREPERAGLFYPDPNSPNGVVRETNVGHPLRKGLRQVVLGPLCRGEDVLLHGTIIESIFGAIAAASLAQSGKEHDADEFVLLLASLFVAQSQHTAHQQVLDQAPIHHHAPPTKWPPPST